MKITVEQKQKLQEGVKEAFLKSTGRELLISPTKGNSYFNDLRTDIIRVLDINDPYQARPPQDETLIRFFFRDVLSFDPQTVRIFQEYILVCNRTISEGDVVTVSKFEGVDHIDASFKKRIIDSFKKIKKRDIYLAKQIDRIQWFGALKDFYVKTPQYRKIVKAVTQSFKESNNNKISAVVCGNSGTGKSTVLRLLACEFIHTNISVLWLKSIHHFRNDIGKFSFERRYLLIIDDWYESLKAEVSSLKLLHVLNQFENIRLVISDRQTINREYLDFLDSNCIFKLSTEENVPILQKVVEILPEWEEAYHKISAIKAFSKSSIYLLLFVISKTSAQDSVATINEDRDFSQFKSIIRRDLELINRIYPGLAKALYYWFSLERDIGPLITWEAFLKLADHYNKNGIISKNVEAFEMDDPICELLSYYFTPHPFVEPDLLDKHLLLPHSEILSVGLSQNIDESWVPYSKAIKRELLAVLLACGEINIGALLFDLYKIKGNILTDNDLAEFYSIIGETVSFSEQLETDILFRSLFDISEILSMDDYENLIMVLVLLPSRKNDRERYHVILKTLIERGCKYDDILDDYNDLDRFYGNIIDMKRIFEINPKSSDRSQYTIKF